MEEIKNCFTHDELFIIKLALNKEISFLSNLISNIKNSNDEIKNLRDKQNKIETILFKVNDLIEYGTVNMYSEADLRKVLLNSFEQFD